jgi:hypothetical protein
MEAGGEAGAGGANNVYHVSKCINDKIKFKKVKGEENRHQMDIIVK